MNTKRKNRTTLMLAGIAVGMFGFAFALVPLYEIICEITGINGKGSNQAALLEEIGGSAEPADREVTVQLLAKVARGMPWEFRPMDAEMVIRPGEMNTTTYYVRNRSHKTVTGQAVPSISPGQASLYMKKIECFCFQQQELAPGAEMEMGVRFMVEADMPADIEELTLSYTMFHVGEVDHRMAGHHE